MFDASVFSHRDLIPFLLNLYRKGDWFKINPDKTVQVDSKAIKASAEGLRDKERIMAANVIFNVNCDPSFLVIVDLVARLVGEGPKIFRPTLDQCLAMEQVSIDLTVGEYEQAYPVVVIEFPPEYIAARNICFPYIATMRRDKSIIGLRTNIWGADPFGTPPNFQTDFTALFHDARTIEQKMGARYNHDTNSYETVTEDECRSDRVVFNLNLLLTHYGSHLADNPQIAILRRRKNSSDDPTRRRRARFALAAAAQEINFSQVIQFHSETRNIVADPQGGGGWHVKPHWRRGHWRTQAYGSQFALRRKIFIKPMLIRREIEDVDMAMTSTTYIG